MGMEIQKAVDGMPSPDDVQMVNDLVAKGAADAIEVSLRAIELLPQHMKTKATAAYCAERCAIAFMEELIGLVTEADTAKPADYLFAGLMLAHWATRDHVHPIHGAHMTFEKLTGQKYRGGKGMFSIEVAEATMGRTEAVYDAYLKRHKTADIK